MGHSREITEIIMSTREMGRVKKIDQLPSEMVRARCRFFSARLPKIRPR